MLAKAAPKLLTLGDPPASAFQSAGITGVSYRAGPGKFLYRQGFAMLLRMVLNS